MLKVALSAGHKLHCEQDTNRELGPHEHSPTGRDEGSHRLVGMRVPTSLGDAGSPGSDIHDRRRASKDGGAKRCSPIRNSIGGNLCNRMASIQRIGDSTKRWVRVSSISQSVFDFHRKANMRWHSYRERLLQAKFREKQFDMWRWGHQRANGVF
jgi:hypothetical protein